MRALIFLLSIVLTSAAAEANAQDGQTPENAHRFITTVLENGYSVAMFHGHGVALTPVEGARALDACVTEITIKDDLGRASGTINWGTYRGIVDWRKVIAVKTVDGRPDQLYLQGAGIEFNLGAENLATRFQYAATVLRDSCDPTAGMGF